MGPDTLLKKYMTNDSGQRVGVIIATRAETDGVLRVGWSLINERHNDKYDNYLGHKIAYGRIDKSSSKIIPQRIKEEVLHMAGRAAAYFKCEVEISGIVVEDLDTYRKEQTQLAKAAKAQA